MSFLYLVRSLLSIAWWQTGANLDVDVSWKYLQFFMEDDNRLKEVGEQYGSGSMLTGEIKAELIKVMYSTL